MYVLDARKAVSEMARILTPDGCAVADFRGSMDALSHGAVQPPRRIDEPSDLVNDENHA
jgi:hypothetical protein